MLQSTTAQAAAVTLLAGVMWAPRIRRPVTAAVAVLAVAVALNSLALVRTIPATLAP